MVASGIWSRPETRTGSPPIARFAIDLPAEQHVQLDWDSRYLAIPPDGQRLVWIKKHGVPQCIYTGKLDDLEVHRIPGTEGSDLADALFSPDSRGITLAGRRGS